MKGGRVMRAVPTFAAAIAIILTAAALVFAIYFSQMGPQWVTFLAGVLVAAALAAATRASNSEWILMRRTAQLSATRKKLERESELRKKAEEALAASKPRLNLLDSELPIKVALVDADGICRYHNRAFLSWLGKQPEQVGGRHLRDVLGIKVYQEIASANRQALTGKSVRYERTQVLPDKTVSRVWVEHLPQFSGDGKVSGFYMVVQDNPSAVTSRSFGTGTSTLPKFSPPPSEEVVPTRQDSDADQDMYIDSFSENVSGQKDAGKQIMEAIENDEFCLYCQRIAPLADSAGADHYEILIRLIDEEESMIPPGAFFPLAERLGLMSHLDRWVVQHVADWVASLGSKPEQKASSFFINVSGATIRDPSFPEFLQSTLQHYEIPATALCFEIPNAELVANNAEVAAFATSVRQCGCMVALGGFGRDRVLFDLIRGFQIEFLKIDGSVILSILQDPVTLAKVKAVSGVAKKIGVKTVAEFVESEEMITRLREIGIDYGQGFGISRPRPLVE